jgi:hypothetical protein
VVIDNVAHRRAQWTLLADHAEKCLTPVTARYAGRRDKAATGSSDYRDLERWDSLRWGRTAA